jgi:hypothetical protein
MWMWCVCVYIEWQAAKHSRRLMKQQLREFKRSEHATAEHATAEHGTAEHRRTRKRLLPLLPNRFSMRTSSTRETEGAWRAIGREGEWKPTASATNMQAPTTIAGHRVETLPRKHWSW